MDINTELDLSYYRKVSDIDEKHNVALVRHIESGRFFVRKILKTYKRNVFEMLKKSDLAGIPRIFEIAEDEGHLIIIEEYISGRTLADILGDNKDNWPFSTEKAADLIISLCMILKPLHENEPAIIHRDIKPSNIMITDEGSVYLIDFNAGKTVDPEKDMDTQLIGTKGYAAPEQFGFAQSDARTDIYALGVLLRDITAYNNQSDADLNIIIEKCMRFDPDDRYQNVSELCNALQGKTCSGSFLPPGFRSRKPAAVIAALLWYFFIIYIMVSEFPEKGAAAIQADRADSICMGIWLILSTLVCGNYRGMAAKLPLVLSDDRKKRILGYILCIFVLLVIMAAVSLVVKAIYR